MVKRLVWGIVGVFTAFALFQMLYEGTPNAVPPKERFEVIAHRGVHVNWEKGTYDRRTGCEATHIYSPTHLYIENTLPSIEAAFEMGATIVEIDIRRTRDNQLVVFHDGRLKCRTNGEGEVSAHSLDYVQTLDIGYGYTHDDGQTYPLRGKGVGAMPTLVEVLQTFPDKRFWIDHKDGSMETAALLVDILETLPLDQQQRLYYWGPGETYMFIHDRIPAVTRLLGNRSHMKTCFLPYMLTFGISAFPEGCTEASAGVPAAYAPFIWGWPYRFLRKAANADIQFYLVIDTEQDAQAYAHIPVDGIVTDYVEIVGKYFDE